LLIEQIPITKLLLVLTFRPEFMPPWKPCSHLSQLILNRLGQKLIKAMIEKVAFICMSPRLCTTQSERRATKSKAGLLLLRLRRSRGCAQSEWEPNQGRQPNEIHPRCVRTNFNRKFNRFAL